MASEQPREASIFNAARSVGPTEARARYLDEACGDDAGLRERVEKLLATFDAESQFLEQPAPGLAATSDSNAIKQDRASSLEAGLTAAFSADQAVVIGDQNHSVLKMLSNTLDETPRVALREPNGGGVDPIVRPASPEVPKANADSRYRVDGEIARGGMGAILKGRDTDLGRDLAIKVLLDAHKDNPQVIQRFIEEAQIGGQLQHPGIAPIYELGQFADKRPFFAMKLVKGETLAKLLADRKDAADERGRFIGIFEQVCQTMAYAHSRGVIHRDLKPANIMVGAFGEVQVMDWGLAKVLQTGGVADEKNAKQKQQGQSIIQTMRSMGSDAPGSIGSHGSGGSETQMGSVMGTPAYMPPEQALGEIDQMGQPADVFGLGAILAEILTGKPPYIGDDGTQVYRLASRGKLDDCFARLDACGADHDLISMTKHCLELEPADRPKDAGALAQRVTDYQDSVETKLRETELQRASEAARVVEQKKRLRVTIALAAAVFMMLLGGGSFAWWQNQQAQLVAQREARSSEAIETLMNQCKESLMEDEIAKAALLLRAAKTRSEDEGGEVFTAQLDFLTADLQLLEELDAINQLRWAPVDGLFADYQQLSKRIVAAMVAFGFDPQGMSASDIEERVSHSVVRDQIRAALDWVLVQKRDPKTREALNILDPDEYRGEFRDAIVSENGKKMRELVDIEKLLQQPTDFIALIGGLFELPMERSRQLLAAAIFEQPNDIDLLLTMGSSYHIGEGENPTESLRWHQAAVACAPKNVSAMISLANSLIDVGQKEAALICFQKAIELDPDNASSHHSLGDALLRSFNDASGARACFRRASNLATNDAFFHVFLASSVKHAGDSDFALELYRKAIEIEPYDSTFRRKYADALWQLGDLDGAKENFYLAIELEPNDPSNYAAFGDWLQKQGDWNGALFQFNKAIDLNPDSAYYISVLGRALEERGELTEAIAQYRTAITLEPHDGYHHLLLGSALEEAGDLEGARSSLLRSVELAPSESAFTYWRVGDAFIEEGKIDSAIESYNRAIELHDPAMHADYVKALGDALNSKGETEAAIDNYKKAIANNPDNAELCAYLGDLYIEIGNLNGAINYYQQAILIDSDNILTGYYYLALAKLFDQNGDFDGGLANYRRAIARFEEFDDVDMTIKIYREAIENRPDDLGLQRGLGDALMAKGDHNAAFEYYQIANSETEWTLGFCRADLGDSLWAMGDADAAIAWYQNGIKVIPDECWIYIQAVWTMATVPDKDGNYLYSELAVAWAQKAAELEHDDSDVQNTLGVALCRAGQWQHARNALLKSIEFGEDGPYNWLFLAMANWKLDQKDKAQEWYDKSLAWKAGNADELAEDAELQGFFGEAATLLVRTVNAASTSDAETKSIPYQSQYDIDGKDDRDE